MARGCRCFVVSIIVSSVVVGIVIFPSVVLVVGVVVVELVVNTVVAFAEVVRVVHVGVNLVKPSAVVILLPTVVSRVVSVVASTGRCRQLVRQLCLCHFLEETADLAIPGEVVVDLEEDVVLLVGRQGRVLQKFVGSSHVVDLKASQPGCILVQGGFLVEVLQQSEPSLS